MNRHSLLLKLLLILIICSVIFVVKVIFIKKYLSQDISTDKFVQTAPVNGEKKENPAQPTGSTAKIGDAVVKIAIADTPASRQQGLSGHPGLKSDEGLLFIFENSERVGFWMKDMLFSIDMIWIDDSGKIVYIKKNATPASYPEVFTPTTNAKYVLEVVAGFTDQNNISVGDQVEFFLSHL